MAAVGSCSTKGDLSQVRQLVITTSPIAHDDEKFLAAVGLLACALVSENHSLFHGRGRST